MSVEIVIYNDVYAMYSFEGAEVFGVEIYNKRLAQMQKQIFDFLFAQAQEMTILSDRGEAKLIRE